MFASEWKRKKLCALNNRHPFLPLPPVLAFPPFPRLGTYQWGLSTPPQPLQRMGSYSKGAGMVSMRFKGVYLKKRGGREGGREGGRG